MCSKTKINTLLMYGVLDKATIITGVVPLLPVSKRGWASKKQPFEGRSVHSLQVESIFPVAHNAEKVKMDSLSEIGHYECSKAKC